MPTRTDEWYLPRRTSNGGTCVETMFTEDEVLVRNNLQPDAGVAKFSHEEWRVFIAGVKDGDYDV